MGGTSLSGLTIDQCAYIAGQSGKPIVVFDMTKKPVESCQGHGAWKDERDTLLQGPIDESILGLLAKMEWFADVFDFVPSLCLSSLKALKTFVEQNEASALVPDAEQLSAHMVKVDQAILDEVER